jgi:sortase A
LEDHPRGGEQATEWEVPLDDAGFHKESAYPGHSGNTAITGHHNMGREVFRHLIDLEIGDEVILYVHEIAYRYLVSDKMLLLEKGASEAQRRENARWIAPTYDERLTLVTCWPYSGNSHRLIVVARPLP